MRRKGTNSGCLGALFQFIHGKDVRNRPYKNIHYSLWGPKGTVTRFRELGGQAYKLEDSILSPHETRFFHVLQSVVGPRAIICPKVRMADFLSVTVPKDAFWIYFKRISQKHVDFLLCDPVTLCPRVAVELDDRSHDNLKRQERDQFVRNVYDTVGLPLVSVRGKQAFTASALNKLISPHLPEMIQNAVPSASIERLLPEASTPSPCCPICGGETKVRVARNDKYAGREFYVCLNYPKCRGLIPVNGNSPK